MSPTAQTEAADQGSAQSLPGCAASPATSGSEPSAAFTGGTWNAESGGSLMPPSERLIIASLGTSPEGYRQIRTIARTSGNAGRDESLANARLIAAAPALLAELAALLTAVTYTAPPTEFGTPDDPNPCFEARVPVEFVERARAAIAKATA